jgi:hypothetical protein
MSCGVAFALLLFSPASARVLPRQQTDGSGLPTVGATTTYAVSVESTYANNNAPTATFSANVTTTAVSASATASSSNWPTKYYRLEFTRGWVDTNGNPRQAILINGQTPGPLIEAEEGQELTVSDCDEDSRTSANTPSSDRGRQPPRFAVHIACSWDLSVF